MSERITTIKAVNYMKEWLHFSAVKKLEQDDGFLFFTARNQIGEKTKLRVNILAESDSWEIYEYDNNNGWQWIDAIPVEE